MTEEREIQCGDIVEDKVTEIKGVVVVRHDYLHGVARLGIQPKGSFEGKPHETIHIDMYQAELKEANAVNRANTIAKTTIPLGADCVDSISGFSGVCTGRAEWLYSCTKVCISPRGLNNKTGEPIKSCWFDEPSIKLIEDKSIDQLKIDVPKKKRTGGFGNPVSNDSFNCSSR